ncbi:hypothetical protein Pla100_29660 [Neorhodopirellula pilleata]|uniref:Uncharacterized protein n=1 Tax=Neorhodopirellula pilleata TaxID=2714738 RepID=A0A5C6ABG8_9BACT|nr:hypothetical protein Pla100_29660 [Neorhodopirellula pilleata]
MRYTLCRVISRTQVSDPMIRFFPRSSFIELNPVMMAIVWAVLSVFVCIIGSFNDFVRHQVFFSRDDPIAEMHHQPDLVEEPSLSQWFGSSLHLSAVFLLIGIGMSIGREMHWSWSGISAIALLAFAGEVLRVFEMRDRPIRELLGERILGSILVLYGYLPLLNLESCIPRNLLQSVMLCLSCSSKPSTE